MFFASSAILLAVLSGVLNGTSTLPMRFLSRWNWENVWMLFIVVAGVVLPVAMAFITVSDARPALSAVPTWALIGALACGFAWGWGAVMFGLGISALGVSLGNTLVLAVSASFGSFFPILVLAPHTLVQRQGKAVLLGTAIGIVGFGICGYAGMRREQSQAAGARDGMFGESRPFWAAFLLCSGAGLLSAVKIIGYSLGQGILKSAQHHGNTAFAGSNLIWLLILPAGTVSNLGYCGYLLRRERSWSKYFQADSLSLYGLSVLMALLWAGGVFIYGLAATKLGKIGPAIGWPLSLTASLLTANVCGVITSEWKKSRRSDRLIMGGGLIVLVAAIVTLGWASTLG